jgi:AcrR family transcriptional regulator
MAKIPKSDRTRARGAVRLRLTKALEAMTQEAGPSRPIGTIAQLCRLADVSRNALYRYHPEILAAVRKHQSTHTAARSRYRKAAERTRRVNIDLREEVAKLAALVDHYYTAYRATAIVLERRDRELAELRGNLHSRPALLVSAIGSTTRKKGPSAAAPEP